MIYKYFFICVLLSSSLITSCAKKEEEEFSSVEPISSILGEWSSGCTEDGIIVTYNFTSATSFTGTVHVYQDAGCSVMGYVVEVSQDYVLSNWQTEEARQVGEIDWTYQAYTMTPSSPQVATIFNNYNYCGFTNWTSGIPKSVLGATCNGQTLPSAGTVDYDLIQYTLNSSLTDQGFTPGDLTYGRYDSAHDGTSPSSRPIESNPSMRLRR